MNKHRSPSAGTRRKSAARLAAVQALYQVDLGDMSPDTVLQDFLQHGIGSTALQTVRGADYEDEREVEAALVEPDGELLTSLVRGALASKDDLDRMVAGALSRDWSVERLESVLRSILRAGAFELSTRPDIPPKVTISEYVDIAHAFYSGPEPGLVNAVLDRIAKVVRAEELNRDDPAPR